MAEADRMTTVAKIIMYCSVCQVLLLSDWGQTGHKLTKNGLQKDWENVTWSDAFFCGDTQMAGSKYVNKINGSILLESTVQTGGCGGVLMWGIFVLSCIRPLNTNWVDVWHVNHMRSQQEQTTMIQWHKQFPLDKIRSHSTFFFFKKPFHSDNVTIGKKRLATFVSCLKCLSVL